MIPSVLSDQIRRGLEEYLKTTFQITTPHFNSLLDDFLDAEKEELIKGPYLTLTLPYIKEELEENPFDAIQFPFAKPFRHQKKAFQRLTGDDPQPTIIATGTGSGKTEGFLLPILDYCASHADEKGIKTILIYPMNALANDQSGRIAEYIFDDDNLKGKVRAGLYIGRGENYIVPEYTTMGGDHIITSHQVLQDDPPDILLTNYKMLDYMLLRPKDSRIWRFNEPNTLRYLVVDELHTFDGAQGTDLACLLRRLKSRLKIPDEYLVPIGTSATLGGDEGEEDHQHLLHYAKEVFGRSFPDDAVITEERRNPVQFFSEVNVDDVGIPTPEIATIDPDNFSSNDEYIRSQVHLWSGEELTEDDFKSNQWRRDLGKWFLKHQLLRQLFDLTEGTPTLVRSLLDELKRMHDEFNLESERAGYLLLNSYLVLISQARIPDIFKNKSPFDVNLQMWLREMRRMVGSVGERPQLRYANDLTDEDPGEYLPLLVCRDCGHTGWGGTYSEVERRVETDLNLFYQAFFGDRPNTVFLFPVQEGEELQEVLHRKLCTKCMHLHSLNDTQCSSCLTDEYLLTVHKHQEIKQLQNYNVIIKDCPRCGSHNSLTIIGARSSTLSAVSVSQFYASPYSGSRDQKKLLAFSDSVQDASHRSGFFTGRTYQFNLRGAIQQFLNNTDWQGSLAELPGAFSRHYRETIGKDEDYIAQFIPPDMQWLDDYEVLIEKDKLPENSNLIDLVNQRVAWEIYSEYGHRALIGRTLEKSGSSMVRIDDSKLTASAGQITERLRAKVGTLRQVDERTVTQLIFGMLYNLRTRGGIYYSALDKYIQNWGNPYVLKKNPAMPKWGRPTRTPSFLTDKRDANRFQNLLAPNRNTWHQRWAEKVLSPDTDFIESYIEEIYDIILTQLVNQGLLQVEHIGRNRVWSIPADIFNITREVEQLQCDRCGHRLQAPQAEMTYWTDASCIQYHCSGNYQIVPQPDHYYKRLYADGHIKRIRSAEHTGLLDRETRENIETKFKEQEHSWDPNLLSATPTLEMGIDIGDLNSVFLCSVPPNQANYVQRVGRAGRKSGTSFNLTVAEAIAHDLYFYADPLFMIDGRIDTPGCFLDAVAILIRQFFAFTLDRYVEHFGENANIHHKLGQNIRAHDREDHESFPHKYIDYFNRLKNTLFDDFVDLFEQEMTDETKKRLKEHIEGSSKVQKHLIGDLEQFLNYKGDELADFRKRRREINQTIRDKEQNPVRHKEYEKIIRELRREATALSEFIKSIDKENIFQALTNEGLLPNYAFPESGIKLKSIIYKKVDEEYETEDFEYIRPASAGIREFAPDNTFYVEGRKIKIDKVNLNLSNRDQWRFCPSCHHTERVPEPEEKPESKCPRCGDIQWADADQTHDVVELRQVEATSSNRESYSWDENEERDPKFYVKNMLVQVGESKLNVESAFQLETENVPFAFEFIRRIRLLDINFGEKPTSNHVKTIAGNQVPSRGFEVCPKCGRAADSRGSIEHTRSCSNYDDEEARKEYFYLYRELNSEALRIMLPSVAYDLDSPEHHSFNAAMYLGLREYFEGNIDHLRTTYMQENSPRGNFRAHYLVLYDTIPGGTGYLKQLMENEDQLKIVFEKALERLRKCQCRTEDKPGCYQCIYIYRLSYKMSNINSPLAIEILSKILDRWDTIEEVETIDVINTNKYLQSQLEKRFIDRLDDTTLNGKKSYLIKDQVHGKDGWRWHWGDHVYRIEPQVFIDDHADIGEKTKADFVIWSMNLPDDIDTEHRKPIAIYTDGFEYHKNQLDDDFVKRCEVINNSEFRIWNITWVDLNSEEDAAGKGLIEYDEKRFKGLVDNNLQPDKIHGFLESSDLWMKGNGFQTLLAYLENPDPLHWNLLTHFIALSTPGPNVLQAEGMFEQSMDDLIQNADNIHPAWNGDLESNGDELFLKGFFHSEPASQTKLGFLFTIPKSSLNPGQHGFTEGTGIIKLWDDDAVIKTEHFKVIWEAFLHHTNFLQFLDNTHIFTTRGISKHLYSDWITISSTSVEEEDKFLQEIKDIDLLDDSLRPFTHHLSEKQTQDLKVAHEILGDQGQVLGEAELAWAEEKVAILGEWQLAQQDVFEKEGWTIFEISEAVSTPDKVLENILT